LGVDRFTWRFVAYTRKGSEHSFYAGDGKTVQTIGTYTSTTSITVTTAGMAQSIVMLGAQPYPDSGGAFNQGSYLTGVTIKETGYASGTALDLG
jgi:hypothetical protein